MMVLPQSTTADLKEIMNNHGNGLLILGPPRDLHKKRFHREKKIMRQRLRRSRSLPMSSVVDNASTSAAPPGDAPLSPDRWGTNNSSSKKRTGRLPQMPQHSLLTSPVGAVTAVERPGFHEGTSKQTKKDHQIRQPRRQRSFGSVDSGEGADRDTASNSFPTRVTVPRSKSNIETVARVIDCVMEQLRDENQRV